MKQASKHDRLFSTSTAPATYWLEGTDDSEFRPFFAWQALFAELVDRTAVAGSFDGGGRGEGEVSAYLLLLLLLPPPLLLLHT